MYIWNFLKLQCTNSTIMNMPKLKGYLNMNTGSLFQHKGDISLKYVNSSFQLHVVAFLWINIKTLGLGNWLTEFFVTCCYKSLILEVCRNQQWNVS